MITFDPISIPRIVATVAAYYHTSPARILSGERFKSIAYIRAVAMFLARRLTGNDYASIGREMNRDHTTIIHGVRRIRAAIETDPLEAARVRRLIEILTQENV